MRIFFGLVHNPFSAGLKKAADTQINLWTLRRLAKNPGLQAACAENLRGRIERRQLLAAELFQFPLPVIKGAVEKAALEPLAELAGQIEKGQPLPLWKKKNCYFEPLHAGTTKLLFIYHAIPRENRERFLELVKVKNPQLHELAVIAIKSNLLITWSRDAADVLRNLGEIMAWFHLIKRQ